MRAGGATNMHLAIQQGCDLLEDRKEQYRRGGVPYFRPIVVLFSDGLPTSRPSDEMEQANQRLVDMESGSQLTIFKVGGERGGGAGDAESVAQSQLTGSSPSSWIACGSATSSCG